jgi:hypothetical protein
MALKNPSVNCFRKFKRLQLTFQVVLIMPSLPHASQPSSTPESQHLGAAGQAGARVTLTVEGAGIPPPATAPPDPDVAARFDYVLSSVVDRCHAYMQWLSPYSPEERARRRQQAVMERQPATPDQLHYLDVLGDQGPLPAHKWEASRRIDELLRRRGA